MSNEKTFCVECREDVTYTVKNENAEEIMNGIKYKYVERIAYCDKCGCEIYIGELNDSNLRALYDKYREDNNIISIEKILEIPKKYEIEKRSLSTLLGWDEKTFSHYCDGDVPTKIDSEILQKIYDDPKYYEEILDKNKGALKNKKEYIKSKKATENISK